MSWKPLLCGHVNFRSFSVIKSLRPSKPLPKAKPVTGTDLINRLDSQAKDGAVQKKDRIKLNRSLQQKAKPALGAAGVGILEHTAEEISDYLNEALASAKLCDMFKGVRKASNIVEISECIINQDFSHVTAYWSSDLANDFTKFLNKKGTSQTSLDADKLAERLNHTVTKTLQSCEGVFRAHIMKKMEFRRVPRVFFRPLCEKKKANLARMNNEVRQEFLREVSKRSAGPVDLVKEEGMQFVNK